ncbi:LysR family transcriptional regulator [Kitasatospora nipponensis]
MDLRRLRYFVAVAEELHFGRAAARLQMSQPPLSRSVRELEEELDCLLLERSARGVRLTAAGAVLLAEARDLLATADRARQRVRATEGHGTVLVGSVAGAGVELGPPAVAAFRRGHPRAEVLLRESPISDPTAGLRSGRVDVALTRLPFDTEGLATHPLGSEGVVAALAGDDPLARRGSLTVEELRDRPWVQLPPGTDEAWRAYWLGGGASGGAGPVVTTVAECLHAVLWQRATALLPAGAVRHHPTAGVRYVPVPDHPPSTLVLAWRAGSPAPLVRAFLRAAAGG